MCGSWYKDPYYLPSLGDSIGIRQNTSQSLDRPVDTRHLRNPSPMPNLDSLELSGPTISCNFLDWSRFSNCTPSFRMARMACWTSIGNINQNHRLSNVCCIIFPVIWRSFYFIGRSGLDGQRKSQSSTCSTGYHNNSSCSAWFICHVQR